MKKGWVISLVAFFLLVSSFIARAEDVTTAIKSTACTTDRCFVRPGENTLVIEIGAKVDDKKVYFLFPQERILKKVNECSGGTCKGTATLDCKSGDAIQVLITNPSSPNVKSVTDDGKQLVGQATFLCDKDPPAFADTPAISLASGETLTNEAGKPLFKSFDQMKIKANISEPLGDVNISADFTGIGGQKRAEGTCTKTAGVFACEITSAAPEGPSGKGAVTVYATDTAGNIQTFEFKDIQVLKTQEATTVEAWTVGNTQSSPTAFNKDIILYFNKLVVVTGAINPSLSGYDVLKADLNDGCQAIKGGGANIAKQQIGFQFDRTSGSFIATITVQSNNVPETASGGDTYTFNCTISLLSKKDKKIYTTPEKDSFTFTLTGYHALTTDEAIKKTQEDLRNEVQKDFTKWNEQQKGVKIATNFCFATSAVQGASGVLETSGAAAKLVPGGQGVGTTLSTVSSKTDKIGEKIYKPVQPACEFLTCDSKYQTFFRDKVNSIYSKGLLKSFAKFAEETTGQDTSASFDPYKSYIWAYGTGCYPAIIYDNLKLTELKCEKLRCIEQDVPAGFPISQCSQSYSFMTCKHYVGGINQGLPILNLLQDTTKVFQSLFSNPFGAALGIATLACKKEPESTTIFDACWLPIEANKLSTVKKQIDKMINDYQGHQVPGGACSNVLSRNPNQDFQVSFNPFNDVGTQLKCTDTECVASVDGKYYRTDSLGEVYQAQTDDGQAVSDEVLQRAHIPTTGTAGADVQANIGLHWKSIDKKKDMTQYIPPAVQRQLGVSSFKQLSEQAMIEMKKKKEENIDAYFQDNAQGVKSAIDQMQTTNDKIDRVNEELDGPWGLRSVQLPGLQAQVGPATAELNKAKADLDQARADYRALQDEADCGETCAADYPALLANQEQKIKELEDKTKNNGDYDTKAKEEQKTQEEKIKQMQNKIKDAEDKKKIIEKEKEDKIKNLNKQVEFEAAYGSGWKRYSTAISFTSTFNQVSKMFFPKQDFGGYTDFMDSAFEKVNGILHFEDAVCRSKIVPDPVSNLVLNNVNGITQSGAHVEGQKDGPVKDQYQQDAYNYLITGAVQPKTPKDLHVQFIGKGSAEKVLRDYQAYEKKDENGNTIGYDLVKTDHVVLTSDNQPTSTTESLGMSLTIDMGSDPIRITMSNDNFNTICIKFQSDPHDHFNEVILDHNELCNDLVS